jgi:hypothetical protein
VAAAIPDAPRARLAVAGNPAVRLARLVAAVIRVVHRALSAAVATPVAPRPP